MNSSWGKGICCMGKGLCTVKLGPLCTVVEGVSVPWGKGMCLTVENGMHILTRRCVSCYPVQQFVHLEEETYTRVRLVDRTPAPKLSFLPKHTSSLVELRVCPHCKRNSLQNFHLSFPYTVAGANYS